MRVEEHSASVHAGERDKDLRALHEVRNFLVADAPLASSDIRHRMQLQTYKKRACCPLLLSCCRRSSRAMQKRTKTGELEIYSIYQTPLRCRLSHFAAETHFAFPQPLTGIHLLELCLPSRTTTKAAPVARSRT